LDLGSGGGLPGLVLASIWTSASIVLVEAGHRRSEFLRRAVVALGCSPRVSVVEERAEVAGRRPDLRARFDLVTARSFGVPGVTAECGAPFLRIEGLLVVSEVPEAETVADRWPGTGLGELGLRNLGIHREGFAYRLLLQEAPCPERYPRRVGVPAKRPLF
jgi:16S rRNA (guanine527-N7)-methyltransferase